LLALKEFDMKLSIITVNLNNKDGLQKTIDSVISQTFKDFEWIVIDGGSTDGSKELIEKYSDYISYWVSEPDKGIYNAMNKGIEVALGEYLLFLNSGDILFEDHTLSFVFNLNIKTDIISGQVERNDTHALLRKYNPNIFFQIYDDTLNHQGTFIKRDLCKKYKYDESLRIVSDWKFWIESIILNHATITVIDSVISIQDMDGLSNLNKTLSIEERHKIKNIYFPSCVQNELNTLKKIEKSDIYKNITYLKEYSPKLYALIYRLSFWLANASKRLKYHI